MSHHEVSDEEIKVREPRCFRMPQRGSNLAVTSLIRTESSFGPSHCVQGRGPLSVQILQARILGYVKFSKTAGSKGICLLLKKSLNGGV